MITLHGLTHVFGHCTKSRHTSTNHLQLLPGCHGASSCTQEVTLILRAFSQLCRVWWVCMRRSSQEEGIKPFIRREWTGSQRDAFIGHMQYLFFVLLDATISSPRKARAVFNTAFTTYPEWLLKVFSSSLITWNACLISPSLGSSEVRVQT